MKLGIPAGVDHPLGRRFVMLTVARLLLLAVLTLVIEAYYFREIPFGGFSSIAAASTVGAAFLFSAIYMLLLRHGKWLGALPYAQLATDQLAWTAIVYLSGGVTSGSASLYGLTAVSGAIVIGTRGAVWAAALGMISYLVMAAGLATGLLLPPADQPIDAYVVEPQQMVFPLFSTLLATALVSALSSYLSERLRATGGRLEEATRRAEEAERLAALGKLAAALAHEIRNPLGSIRGSIELLRSGASMNEEDRRLCEIVVRETARLDDLVTDMMDLSRPRSPEKSVVDLASVARSVVELARRSAHSEDVEIRFVGPASLQVRADAAQMRQVLWNLVRNALQASDQSGEVTVAIERDEGEAVMRVEDHGVGIPDSKREHIFEAFFTTRAHGVGIGLAVVKQVIDAHGFAIDVTSTPAKRGDGGTTFTVRIPARDVVTSHAPRALSAALLALALASCGGQEWVHDLDPDRDEGEIWWGFDVDGQGHGSKPKASASAAPGAPSAQPVTVDGQKVETFRNTYYDFPQEPTTPESGATKQLFDASCKSIRTVSATFHDQVCVQGSGRLASGETVSFAKRDCSCAAICPRSSQKICFEKLDPTKFPYGRGATGGPITPLRSVAVDPSVIPLGTVLYLPDFHGLHGPDGTAHDGCFIAEDKGLKVVGKHIDIFTGDPSTTASWNKAVPSNQGVRVIIGASRCAHLQKQ